MADRYFSTATIRGEHVTLADDEARHLAKVMRAKPGDAVLVFDGSGAEFACEVTNVGRHEVQLRVRERRDVNREARRRVTLAVSLPKGDRQKTLVEKLTELGAACLQPLRTERSVAQPEEKALSRLKRAVIEASKQCGRNVLMDIAPAAPWVEFAAAAPQAVKLLAHPGAEHSLAAALRARAVDQAATQAEPEFLIAIGPEGGFTDEEVALAQQHGWTMVTLGRSILRVETAAMAAAAAVILAADA